MVDNSKKYKVGRDSLTEKEIETLLNSFDRISDKALIQLAIACGIRRADIVNIKRADFNFEAGNLKFEEHKKNRIWEVVIPSERCIATLKQHLNSSRNSIWLFPSSKTTGKYKNMHLSDRQAYDVLNEACDRCKISRRPFHALRATCVKSCLKAGWSWEAISELTGDFIFYTTVSLCYTKQGRNGNLSKGEADNMKYSFITMGLV